MHIFSAHLSEQFERNPNLYVFNLEGLEIYQDFSFKYFFRGTNRSSTRMKQLLCKRFSGSIQESLDCSPLT